MNTEVLPVEVVHIVHFDDIIHIRPADGVGGRRVDHVRHADLQEGAVRGIVLNQRRDRARNVGGLFHAEHEVDLVVGPLQHVRNGLEGVRGVQHVAPCVLCRGVLLHFPVEAVERLVDFNGGRMHDHGDVVRRHAEIALDRISSLIEGLLKSRLAIIGNS